MLSYLLSFVKSDPVYYDKSYSCNYVNGEYTLVEGADNKSLVYGIYNYSLETEGWYRFHVKGREGANPRQMMYCAGLIEGYVSHDGIWNHYQSLLAIKGYPPRNFTEGKSVYPPKVKNFLYTNLNHTRESVDAVQDDPYWVGIGHILAQFDGLRDGYSRADQELPEEKRAPLDEFDHWFFQSAGDMFDIAEIFKDDQPTKEFSDHCTGTVRLLDDYSDLFFSHDAWSDYRELHGELKEYDLPIDIFTSKRLVFSTRIGKISSYDDFYIADSGLFIIETTLNNYNDELYDTVVPTNLNTWLRAVHATWSAGSGKEWSETFIRHNSGTYNNQYVIIDSNQFQRFKRPVKDLIWVIEQFPEHYHAEDVTEVLVEQGWFPSINIPYFEDMYNLAGYPEKVASAAPYGNYFSYYHSPRYLIMQRDLKRVHNFTEFMAFVRYNNWEHDPYCQGDPAQQIASRYDLRPEHTPYGDQKTFGDLDSKALRLTEAVTRMQFHAIASPPYDHNPVWNFSNPKPPMQPVDRHGLPDVWNFTWTTVRSARDDECAPLNESECLTKKHSKWCGWCSYTQTCYPGEKDGPFFNITCDAGWKQYTELQSWAVPVIVATSVIIVVFVGAVYVAHFIYRRKNAH